MPLTTGYAGKVVVILRVTMTDGVSKNTDIRITDRKDI